MMPFQPEAIGSTVLPRLTSRFRSGEVPVRFVVFGHKNYENHSGNNAGNHRCLHGCRYGARRTACAKSSTGGMASCRCRNRPVASHDFTVSGIDF